jgi:hypothetical protein
MPVQGLDRAFAIALTRKPAIKAAADKSSKAQAAEMSRLSKISKLHPNIVSDTLNGKDDIEMVDLIAMRKRKQDEQQGAVRTQEQNLIRATAAAERAEAAARTAAQRSNIAAAAAFSASMG